jgi:hypothetical protein
MMHDVAAEQIMAYRTCRQYIFQNLEKDMGFGYFWERIKYIPGMKKHDNNALFKKDA